MMSWSLASRRFTFCGVFKACPDAPPNPGEAVRNSKLLFQLREHVGILVGVKEAVARRIACGRISAPLVGRDPKSIVSAL
jgi:hypothetical protein